MDKQQRGIQVIRIWLGDDANSWSDESNVIGRYFSVFASIGLPSLFVYGVAAIELIGGLFMIIGFLIPLVSVGFIAVLVGAIFLLVWQVVLVVMSTNYF